MKSKQITLLLLWLCCLPFGLMAQSGTSCYDAVPLTKNYSELVIVPGVKWYKAQSFDLPLTVTFRPSDPTAPAPRVAMDFTCTPGHYSDPILNTLFSPGQGSTIIMPFEPAMNSRTLTDGTKEYYITMGEVYRDLLLQMGIDYNVEVYVQVTYTTTGQVALTPDAFGDCMDATWIKRGQTYTVEPNDKETHYIEPYVQWQDDSLRYIWQGTAPLYIAVAQTCIFDPMDNTNPKMVDLLFVLPGDTVYLHNQDILNTISQKPAPGGVFFCKFYSTSAGTVKVEHIPTPPPAGGAIQLHYNKDTKIAANSLNSAVYAISENWKGAIRFTTPTDHVFRMYVGVTADFTTADAIATYQYSITDTGHELCLDSLDFDDLLQQILVGDHYLYVRFECTAATTVRPLHWFPSDCVLKATLIRPGDQITANNNSTTPLYAINLSDWVGGDMIFTKQTGTSKCEVFIADTCVFTLSASAKGVISYQSIPRQANGSLRLNGTLLQQWKDNGKADADGYLYIRIKTGSGNATIDVTTTRPEEQDPVEPEAPKVPVWVSCNAAGEAQIRVARDMTLAVVDMDGNPVGTSWVQTPADGEHVLVLPAGEYRLLATSDDEELTLRLHIR